VSADQGVPAGAAGSASAGAPSAPGVGASPVPGVGAPIIAIATPLPPHEVARLRELEPSVVVRRIEGLVPEPAFVGDRLGAEAAAHWVDDPRLDDLFDGASVVFGIPRDSPAVLARVLERHPSIRWVHGMTAGAGAVVREAHLDRPTLDRVVFTSSAGAHAGALAEFALFGLLAGAKQLPRLLADQRDGVWAPRRMIGQLADHRVVVVGLGSIGRRVATLLHAFGADVVGVHRNPERAAGAGLTAVVHPEHLAEALRGADGVVMCLPHTAATEHLLDADALSGLAPGAVVVNVGRGATIDEGALIAALRTGQVGYAALDVFEVEPLPVASPLWAMPNVLVSPHTAALSAGEDRRIVERFMANVERFLADEPLHQRVDTVEFY